MNKRQTKKRNKLRQEKDRAANQKTASEVTREQWERMVEWARKRRAELRDQGIDIDD